MDGSLSLGFSQFGGKSCGCSGACDCLPTEFTRLRYAYGQRLGVVELSDEQAYLVGKDRFHNSHCHGAGVLCGLLVERFVWPQNAPSGTTTTVLRVTGGAALDGCGREVLVPCDQCIDVAAWFAVNSPNLQPPPNAGTLNLWVAIRYRECPSDPAPVPRDPCGCDTGGCDYTRVRESFELKLFAGEFPTCAGGIFPAADDLRTAIATDNPIAALDQLTAAPCPTGGSDTWICLAAFDASVVTAGSGLTVSDISVPDNTIPGRQPLLSTAALQSLLLTLAQASGAAGMLETGPSISGISFTGDSDTTGTLTLDLALITDAPSTTPTELAIGTFSASFLMVQSLNTATWAWDTATPTVAGHVSTDGTAITVTWGAGDPALSAGNFRVSLISPDATPIVDQKIRPLQPRVFARDFGLALDSGGTLALAAVTV